MNAELTSLLGAGFVLDQSVAATDDLKKLAEQYQITPGKALLLQRLIEENPNLDYAKLAKLPMNELISYLKQSGVDVRNYVHCTGDDLDDDDRDDDVEDDKDEDEEDEDEEDDDD